MWVVGQYTSLAFTEALTESGIAGSIGIVGDALDNALMESTIGLYKTEPIDRRPPSLPLCQLYRARDHDLAHQTAKRPHGPGAQLRIVTHSVGG